MDKLNVVSLESEIAKKIPGFRVAFKNETWTQKALGFLSKPFNPGYMTEFVTTLGTTVYFPTREHYEARPQRTFTILAHEYVHLHDGQSQGFWGQLGYMLPQALALPFLVAAVVGAFFHLTWLALLVPFAVLLAPWPAPHRAKWEGRGYAMTLAVTYWLNGSLNQASKDGVAKEFYGSSYYFMVWGKARANQIVADAEQKIVAGTIQTEEPYLSVLNLIRDQGLLKNI